MRNLYLVSLYAVVSAATAVAQVTFTTPPGAFHLEGDSFSGVLWGGVAAYQCRCQEADANLIGESRLPLIRKIAWRRDLTGTATSTARTAEFTLVMAHNDFATFTTSFAGNYKDAPVTVFTKKIINLPDWSVLTASSPSPFDLIVPFDVPWVYNRVDALVWEGIVTNTSAGGTYADDWFSVAAAQDWSMTIQENAGCRTPNGLFRKRDGYRTNTTALEIGWEILGGPGNANVTLLLGAQLVNLAVAGLCAPVGVQPLASVPIGTTNASGTLPLASTTIAWNAALAGAEIVAQAAALDATQTGLPVAISNSTRTVLPKVLGNPGTNCKRTFATNSSTATNGSAVTTSAVPTQYSF